MYQRGNRRDYDTLATEGQCPDWSYQHLLPYFKRSENNSDPSLSSNYHGRKGPVGITTTKYPDPILKYVLRAAYEEGTDIGDANGANQTVAMISQSNIKNGIRSSTGNAFIESGICPTLTLVTRALVTKILFRNDPGALPIAYGVMFIKNGKTYTVETKKEIILSAGK